MNSTHNALRTTVLFLVALLPSQFQAAQPTSWYDVTETERSIKIETDPAGATHENMGRVICGLFVRLVG